MTGDNMNQGFGELCVMGDVPFCKDVKWIPTISLLRDGAGHKNQSRW